MSHSRSFFYLFLSRVVLSADNPRLPPTAGPMVWYQKFEYAVGHWLQKTAEHVFGCVLCSPGCFSLFRASALMDDNVLRRYTTTATRASEYVQYDQGRQGQKRAPSSFCPIPAFPRTIYLHFYFICTPVFNAHVHFRGRSLALHSSTAARLAC